MGSWEGAEVCDLIGLYCLSLCESENLGIRIGLYRDDGLCECDKRPQQIEAIKKKLCQIFRNLGLNISIEANKKVVNFLDVTLDLSKDIFMPYLKPNNPLLYVHKDSNHPPSIIKNIPESINKRLSDLSKNEEIFNESVPAYQEALDNAGYTFKFKV